jgi:Chitin binding Peritrophin-A domain
MIDNETKKKNFLSHLYTLRCTRAGLKQITCPSGLAFDIEKQTCDWKAKVDNCDKKESKFSKPKSPLTCFFFVDKLFFCFFLSAPLHRLRLSPRLELLIRVYGFLGHRKKSSSETREQSDTR